MESAILAASSTTSSFNRTLMENNVAWADQMITKWDPDRSSYATIPSIFYESRDEARRFLLAVYDLHQAMHFFAIADNPPALSSVASAQRLMATAMRRLQKEFQEILTSNRDDLGSGALSSAESSVSRADYDLQDCASYRSVGSVDSASDEEEDVVHPGKTASGVGRLLKAAMCYLRSIAECMIASAYSRECAEIYRTSRRSVVADGLFRLGFERVTSSHIQKMNRESLDFRIKRWVAASRPAVRNLFSGERVLCDYVFGSSTDAIEDLCFAEIAGDAAVQFLRFPEKMATKAKRFPDTIFLFLDMHKSLYELWPEIKTVFSYESTAASRSQALSSLQKLAAAVRSLFSDFEASIQKDASKAIVPGGGLHPLTEFVMTHLARLADDHYASVATILTGTLPRSATAAPGSISPELVADAGFPISVTARFTYLLTVLLCKLDGKAELFKDGPLSHLFLANNLQYTVAMARGSPKLAELLGDDWVSSHEQKARLFAKKFLKLGWAKVVDSIPEDPENFLEQQGIDAAAVQMAAVNSTFEEVCRSQTCLVVLDGNMRDEIKDLLLRNVVVRYRAFYDRFMAEMGESDPSAGTARFTPEDMANCLSYLYERNLGAYESGGSTGSRSQSSGSGGSSSGSSRGSRWRRVRESVYGCGGTWQIHRDVKRDWTPSRSTEALFII